MEDLTQFYTALKNADAAGDVEAAKALASHIQQLSSSQSVSQPSQKPLEAQSTNNFRKPLNLRADNSVDKFGGAIPRGFTDILDTIATQGYGRLTGNKEMIGGEAERQAKEWEAQNPDMASKAGRLTGNVLATAPVAPTMGMGAAAANLPRLASALRTGGMTTGAVLPESAKWLGAKGADLALRTGAAGAGGAAAGYAINPDEAAKAGAWSAAIPLLSKFIGAAGQGLGAMVKPFTSSGQEELAANIMRKFAANPEAAYAAMKASKPIVDGSMPSAIMASGDVGLAGLGRTLQSSPHYANELTLLQSAQNQARTKAMEDIAGNTGKISLAKEARNAETSPMREYVLSNASPIDSRGLLAGIDEMLAKPDNAGKLIQSALGDARNSIERIGKSGQVDPRALYAIRKDIGLDISGKMMGEAGNKKFAAGELSSVQKLFDEAIDKASRKPVTGNMIGSDVGDLAPRPTWDQYLKTYTEKSKPINQMEALDDVLKRVQTGAVDQSGGYILSAAKLNNILKNEGSDLAKKLTPSQIDTLRKISADLNASQLAMNSGKAVGSNTVQNIAGNNLLTGLLGDSIGGSVMSRSLAGRLLKLPYGGADDMIREKLGEGLLNPQIGARYLEPISKSQYSPFLKRAPYFLTPALSAQ
jgi:hypothetical protein